MISYWQTISNGLLPIQSFKKNCIVNITSPSEDEKDILKSTFQIPEDIILDIMDVDERSRLEFENDKIIIILRIPIQATENGIPFSTIPLGIIISDDYTLILCQRESIAISEFFNQRKRKAVEYKNKFDFILNLFLHTTNIYHRYLRQINFQANMVEKDLEKSTKNEELHKLLKLEKCLVYFTTSLRSNKFLFARIKASRFIESSMYSEELLEDVMIENKQAIEMANIYSDIQSGMMDAFASVISNNLNIVMKQLTIVTIILAIPTMIASFYGMNVPNYFENTHFAFWSIIAFSIIIASIGIVMIRKRRWI
ncbi:MAG: magnesium transporter CorA family protein [Bacteroidales bacterium]|nr:magnesium transporter CorA family protein [Bacteroidales bacterium]